MSAGADVVQFKAEVNFDGREVARVHVNKLNLEEVLKVLATPAVWPGDPTRSHVYMYYH